MGRFCLFFTIFISFQLCKSRPVLITGSIPVEHTNIDGDVLLTTDQIVQFQAGFDESLPYAVRHGARQLLRNKFALWPTDKPIPYRIDGSINAKGERLIDETMALWQSQTCLRFSKNGVGAEGITFYHTGSCASYVGKIGGFQPAYLGYGCYDVGHISHELGHNLGFFHEHQRPDRDNYVTVNLNNVEPYRIAFNFPKVDPGLISDTNTPYDYGSVMHYAAKSWGKVVGNETLVVLNTTNPQYQTTIGQRLLPSFNDFREINSAYCTNVCQTQLNCSNGGYENPNNCSECKCPDGLSGPQCNSVAESNYNCGGELNATDEWKSIESPGWPFNTFMPNITCNWLITAPNNTEVRVEFDDLKFDLDCAEPCDKSHVEIKSAEDMSVTGYRLCCSQIPLPIVSKGGKVLIILRTLQSRKSGFSVWYKLTNIRNDRNNTQFN